jgi:ATP-binding cassette subfamily D (ALD) protein 3
VQLSYIVDREGGLDSVKDWYAVLSGGEKQRLAMARLYYHRPKFAVLDECTSAVSDDMRHRLYALCREKGITVFSVAHQRELYKHHQRMIRFDGKGGYEWIVLDSDTLAKMMQPSH